MTDAQSIVPNINGMISAARSDGRVIVYTQDWHPEVTPHFAKDGGIWPMHCVGETWGSEFYRELEVVTDAEFVTERHRWRRRILGVLGSRPGNGHPIRYSDGEHLA